MSTSEKEGPNFKSRILTKAKLFPNRAGSAVEAGNCIVQMKAV